MVGVPCTHHLLPVFALGGLTFWPPLRWRVSLRWAFGCDMLARCGGPRVVLTSCEVVVVLVDVVGGSTDGGMWGLVVGMW